jgi:hypothetical protein
MTEMLFHGGAPWFKPTNIISSHPTKRVDGCPICAAGHDGNHLPDRVFCTESRLYAKYYASKYPLGWLYEVEPEGELVRSDSDPFITYHAQGLRVVRVSERAVMLTMSERRRLYRAWMAEDKAAGRHVDYLTDQQMRAMLEFAR